MTDEELAVDWIRSQGWSEETLPSDEFGQMFQAFLAGYEQAKKDLSCVQQRLNMLEEHNMTIDNVITCLEKHNEIHSRQEPRAYYITKALNIAIDFLKNHRWHYPSKGEFPEHEKDILGYWIGAGFCVGWYNEKQDLWLKNPLHSEWLMQPDAWQYLPEPPKEM